MSRITLDDILVPPRVALRLVSIVLASEALLVVFSMVVGDFFQVFPFAAPYEFHADQSSAVLALSFSRAAAERICSCPCSYHAEEPTEWW